MQKTSKFSRLFSFLWFRDNKKFSDNWDKLLQKLIENGKITAQDSYAVTFDDKYEVWTSNHPWCSGILYRIDGKTTKRDKLCSLKTAIMLEDLLNSEKGYDDLDKVILEDLAKYRQV